MIETEKQVEALIQKYKASLPPQEVHQTHCDRCHKPESSKNKISMDIEQYAFELLGVNLMKIPGIKKGSLFRLAGELGHDFVFKFDSSMGQEKQVEILKKKLKRTQKELEKLPNILNLTSKQITTIQTMFC